MHEKQRKRSTGMKGYRNHRYVYLYYYCCTLLLCLFSQDSFTRADVVPAREAVPIRIGIRIRTIASHRTTAKPATTLRGGNLTPPPNQHQSAQKRQRQRGSSIYELNPNYVTAPHFDKPLTVGDLDSTQNFFIETPPQPQPSFAYAYNARRLTLIQLIQRYTARLYQTNPALAQVTAACLVVFCAWQIPASSSSAATIHVSQLLQSHFVCSRRNMMAGRWTSLLLSAVSHTDLWHVVFNLAALLSLGPKVQLVLEHQRKSAAAAGWTTIHSSSSSYFSQTNKQSQQVLMWPLMIGAALSGSLAFLILGGRNTGGCLGLSAVTMSLLAVYARAFPDTSLSILLAGIVPIRLPAYQLLQVVLWSSALGSIVAMFYSPRGGGVAHSAHLGGLLFGIAYYDCERQRRDVTDVVKQCWRSVVERQRRK